MRSKAEKGSICSCGARLCLSKQPDSPLVCMLIQGHEGMCTNPHYPDRGMWQNLAQAPPTPSQPPREQFTATTTT